MIYVYVYIYIDIYIYIIDVHIHEKTYVLLYALCMNHERIARCMYVCIYIYMIDMIVYASYTHLKTPLTRPHRVSGVDALPKTLITWLEYTEPVLLLACFSHPRSTFMHPGILATEICLQKLTPGGWRSWQVKLQGLEDENLNGKVGVLRSLVASTGKFAIELDGDDARVQFNCIRVTLVKTS